MLLIVGQGLAGTLAGLEAERRGLDFLVVDEGSGRTATRAAAGLFNPLTGPRFTADTDGWDRIVPHYQDLEQRLGAGFLHTLPLHRPWSGAKARPGRFPQEAPGWSARADGTGVWIDGGGWVDLPKLLDAARAHWKSTGRCEERRFSPDEGRGRSVLWCAGTADLAGPVWGAVPGVAGLWQPVRGDVLTVRIPSLTQPWAEVGPRFLVPVGDNLFRWGATHESGVDDQGFRPGARTTLEEALTRWLESQFPDRRPPFEVTGHVWGVRPSSRTGRPLVVRHPDEPGWALFNGLGGRGVAMGPRFVDPGVWWD